MRIINKILIGATIAGAGLATVGMGAGADFVDSPTVHQTVKTGTLLVDLSGGGNTATATTSTPASLTLPPIGPTGSSFTDYKTVDATNDGTVTGTVTDLELTATGDVTPLATDLHETITYGPSYTQLCSGSVAHCTGVNLVPSGGITLAPGQTVQLQISIYAGGNTGAPALTNIDEGKILNTTLTYTVTG
jgi:hypothetical protein